MVKHFSNRYHIQILNYYATQGHERITKKLLHPTKENEEGTPIKTLGVKLLFEVLPLKSQMFDRYLSPLFFTFLQPFFVVLIAFKRLGKNDICIAGGLWGGIIGYALKCLGKTDCLVYDDLDLFPYFWDNKLFQITLYAIEKFVVKKADLVVSVSDALAELRRRQGAKNVIVVPNGVDYNLFSKGQSKKEHVPTLVYVGGLVNYQGVDLPIRCLPELAKAFPNIRFLILGTGPFENELRVLIKNLELERAVFLLGGQKHEKLPDYFSESDIAVATAKPRILTRYSAPYKIPEYMAAGLPIITTKMDERQELQNKLKGIISINLRERDFKDVVLNLFSDAELYRELSEKAIRTAKESDWTDFFKIEFDEIEKTFEKKTLEK
jgi:glycosyltransferase involved in cell wall biosynthesis